MLAVVVAYVLVAAESLNRTIRVPELLVTIVTGSLVPVLTALAWKYRTSTVRGRALFALALTVVIGFLTEFVAKGSFDLASALIYFALAFSANLVSYLGAVQPLLVDKLAPDKGLGASV